MYQLHIKIIELRGDVMFVMFFDITAVRRNFTIK